MKMLASILVLFCFGKAWAEAPGCGKVFPVSHQVGTYSAGTLANHHLGDLYAAYTGVRGLVPNRIVVDPARQLDSLWLAKLSCNATSPIVRKLHQEILSDYREKHSHKTVDEFIAVAQGEVSFVRKEMDWLKFGKLYTLSSDKLDLVKTLALQIDGKDLVAYGLTEIMPSDDGELNVRVLEFLVRNYGPEFVYAIPARFDRYASFGFFQFTSKAVFDAGNHLEGASRASRALTSGNLPGSVQAIRGRIEFRGAYLFAIHNIASLVKRLNGKEMLVLRALPLRNHDDLIQFIAAAHNGPAFAERAALRWIDARMKYEYFVSVSNPAVRRYAVKTKANLAALRASKRLDNGLYADR